MGTNPRDILRAVAKLAAVALGAAAAGAGLGAGFAKVTDDDQSTAAVPLSTGTESPSTAGGLPSTAGGSPSTGPPEPGAVDRPRAPSTPDDGATTSTSTSPSRGSAPGGDAPVRVPRISVSSAVLVPAGSASGRARQRARLRVRLRVTNRSDRPLSLDDAVLVVGDEEVRPDANAAKVSESVRALQRPIEAGKRATGELRFETAGETTVALRRDRRAQLRVIGRTKSLSIELSEPAPPGG